MVEECNLLLEAIFPERLFFNRRVKSSLSVLKSTYFQQIFKISSKINISYLQTVI